MNKPLKILMVLHMPWDRNLGGSRVQLELADEFQSMGHEVTKFDYNDAFSPENTSFIEKFSRPIFSSQAKSFVQKTSHNFDIIDAHQGNLPFSKQELKIKGLLVARSVGLYAFYEKFALMEKTKWPPKRKRTRIKNWLMSLQPNQESDRCFRSFQTCDIINLPNHDELTYVSNVMGFGQKSAVFPFGISQKRQQAFAQTIQPAALRLNNKQVVFIGTWTPRKGARDWAEIIRRTKTAVPEASFLFLGTGFSAKTVLADLELSAYDWIKIIPNFDSEELPNLLSGATVGAFPSYIEGFGFAVLEKLACGLPTVAYDVPGPREMLGYLDKSWMVPTGDIELFSNQLIKVLKMDEITYSKISENCVEVAQKFGWDRIAKNTLDLYCEVLEKHNYFN